MWDPASERCSVTSLAGRPNTALVVIDMQKDVVADAPRVDEVVANIRDLIGRARRADIRACSHESSPGASRAARTAMGHDPGKAPRWAPDTCRP